MHLLAYDTQMNVQQVLLKCYQPQLIEAFTKDSRAQGLLIAVQLLSSGEFFLDDVNIPVDMPHFQGVINHVIKICKTLH